MKEIIEANYHGRSVSLYSTALAEQLNTCAFATNKLLKKSLSNIGWNRNRKEKDMNKNQIVANKLNAMELSEMARNIISDTEIGMMDEMFGSLETEEQVERFIREFYTDSFRVSAVWEDGTTVDNDIVYEVDEDAVKAELEVAREWFADRSPSEYMISYYFEGDVIGADMIEA